MAGGGSEIRIPLPALAPIGQQAVDETIRQVREGYSNKVGARVSTAAGGQAQAFLSVQRGKLAAAGYAGWTRAAGVSAGGEVTWDLRPK